MSPFCECDTVFDSLKVATQLFVVVFFVLFLYDTLAYDDTSPYQVWLQKVHWISGYSLDNHQFKFSMFVVTVNTAMQ